MKTCRDTEAGGEGAVPLLSLKSGGKGSKSALFMLSTDAISLHSLLTFVLLSGSTSYPQKFMTCHEMQQTLMQDNEA